MKRSSVLCATCAVLVTVATSACYVVDKTPPQSGQQTQPQPTGTAPGTTATAPTVATTGTATPPPTGTTTTPPTTGGLPTPGSPIPSGGLPTFPGVCIPIGSWAKKFDSGIPASGSVDIGSPVLFNQFPVNDGVVVANAPLGSLKGVGAMTSTNDLSVDVFNGGIAVSYTCHFSGSSCTEGACTVTKGSLGGFKLVKK